MYYEKTTNEAAIKHFAVRVKSDAIKNATKTRALACLVQQLRQRTVKMQLLLAGVSSGR